MPTLARRVLWLLGEKFTMGVKSRHGYAEVYYNPTTEELRTIADGKAQVQLGGIVDGNDVFLWNREQAEHSEVRYALRLSGSEWLPFYWVYVPAKRDGKVWLAAYSRYKGMSITSDRQLLELLWDVPYFKPFSLTTLA